MELRVAEAVIYCARVLLLPGTLAIIRWLTHQGDTGARHVELLNCCRNPNDVFGRAEMAAGTML